MRSLLSLLISPFIFICRLFSPKLSYIVDPMLSFWEVCSIPILDLCSAICWFINIVQDGDRFIQQCDYPFFFHLFVLICNYA